MKHIHRLTTAITAMTIIASSCSNPAEDNVLLSREFNTPHNVPPFDQIEYNDYVPAFEDAIDEVYHVVDLITTCRDEATFENTIVPFDRKNEHLNVLSNIFFNLRETENCDTLTAIAETLFPMLNEAEANINMNKELFARIKHVYDTRLMAGLDSSQLRVVEKYYDGFVRGGALLSEADQAKLRDINNQLSLLSLSFGNNMLAETNDFKLVIDTVADLSGLPQNIIDMAAERAKNAGLDGKWLFTLHNASIMPFLQFSDKHELRKQIYEAYTNRGLRGNENDNRENVLKMVRLRAERAQLLGYKTHAHYVISENMAATPEAVDSFLNELWEMALANAKEELRQMRNYAWNYNNTTKIEACDWQYWAEKLRKAKYSLEESEITPYFALDNVRNGMFMVANKLYGITFKLNNDMPHYNADNAVYEVYDADSTYLGLIYFDHFPRASKSGGAWCTHFRSGLDDFDGKHNPAQISIVYNFPMPTATAPALLNIDNVETMFHEFGHALHGLFSTGKYRITAGEVPSDYVEMPSQVMENWATDPEVLPLYAKHYQTGEVIPEALIEKIANAKKHNQGFANTEFVAAAILDMKWHSLTPDQIPTDVVAFEKEAMDAIGLIPEIAPRYRSTYFSHIFDGGYSAGYYVYRWANMLDKDVFAAFKESGDIFNQQLAASFRKNCLSEVGEDDAMKQYVKFRGKKPTIEVLK